MTKLRWSNPPKEADPARAQRDRAARVIATPDAERARARALRRLRGKVEDLRARHLAIQAHISKLLVRSKSDARLRPIGSPNPATLRDLQPVEAELARELAKAWKDYRAAYRLAHRGEPPPIR